MDLGTPPSSGRFNFGFSTSPPVRLNFDNYMFECTRDDIKELKSTVAQMQLKLDAATNTIADLRTEVASLRNSASVCRSPEHCNVNSRRGAQNASICSFGTPTSSPAVAESLYVSTRAPAPTPAPALAPLSAPAADSACSAQPTASPPRNYAAVAATQTESKRQFKGKKQEHCELNQGHMKGCSDKDGFVLVKRKKRKPTSTRNRCGTASVPPGQLCLLRPEIPTTQLYVSRVHYAVTVDNVVEYLKQKTGLSIRVDRLESRHNVNFNSFVVRVPTDRLSTYMDGAFWPKGVVFRKFIGRLTRDTPSSSSATTLK